jgi:type I restriction enzyme S subunit
MSKEGKFIPELRFSEFMDDGEWVENKVEDIVSTIAPPKKLPSSNYLVRGIFPIIDQSQSFYCGYTNDNEAIISDHLPLIIFGDHTCILKMAREPFAQGADGIKILKPKTTISPEFLFQFLQYNGVKIEDYKRHFSILKERKVLYPEIKTGEQQKIASCLSSLDEVIAAQSQKLELLKDYKKGLMQNLFPQEGETVPSWRFPEFEGDWEEKKLEDLAKRGSGHTPNKSEPTNYNGGIKWVSLADSSILDNGFIYTTKNEISREGLKNSSAVLHPAGTVIVSRDAGIGKSAVLFSEMAVSQHFIVWVCDQNKMSNWFLYYFLQILKPKLESIAVGSTIKTIGLPYFKELRMQIPSIKEQQKIASSLSSLDALITAQSEKIEQLKWHKKGLMQGLFPKIVE